MTLTIILSIWVLYLSIPPIYRLFSLMKHDFKIKEFHIHVDAKSFIRVFCWPLFGFSSNKPIKNIKDLKNWALLNKNNETPKLRTFAFAVLKGFFITEGKLEWITHDGKLVIMKNDDFNCQTKVILKED